MKIKATSLVVGGGIALTSDDNSGGNEVITVMLRPGETHTVSDRMRSARSIRQAITLGYITVSMDGGTDDTIGPGSDHSDFVAQVELAQLASFVSGLSGFSGSTGIPGIRYNFLDIHGGVTTSLIEEINGTPYLIFPSNSSLFNIWNWTIPEDFVVGTPVQIEIYWSPANATAGNVRWVLEYKSLVPGNIVISPAASSIFIQSSPGVATQLVTTDGGLTIPGGSIAQNSLMTLSVKRDGTDPSDTFEGQAWVHLIRISYTGLRFPP